MQVKEEKDPTEWEGMKVGKEGEVIRPKAILENNDGEVLGAGGVGYGRY